MIRHFHGFIFMCAFLGAFTLNVEVSAQSSRDLDNRLLRLENDMQTLGRAVYRGETPPSTGFPSGGVSVDARNNAQTEVRIQELEGQIRSLTGQIEQQSFQMRQLQQNFDKYVSDTNLRLEAQSNASPNALAGTPNRPQFRRPTDPQPGGLRYTSNAQREAENAEASEGANSGAVEQGLSQDGATLAYENAFALLRNENYTRAESEFQTFLSQYPDHSLAANAKYWLGETYYVRGEYQDAARSFAEGFQAYPESTKTPDSLLKLGMSLAALGNQSDACVALTKLKSDFGASSSPVIRRADVEIARLGCS